MLKEAKGQVKVDVAADLLWRGLSKDIVATVPKIMPNLVEKGQIVEGDGGLGSVILFEFCPGAGEVKYQKEKIMELDESRLRLGLRVTEGGHLFAGFSFYQVTFQLTPVSDNETIVDVIIGFECDNKETASSFVSKSVDSNLGFVHALVKFVQGESKHSSGQIVGHERSV